MRGKGDAMFWITQATPISVWLICKLTRDFGGTSNILRGSSTLYRARARARALSQLVAIRSTVGYWISIWETFLDRVTGPPQWLLVWRCRPFYAKGRQRQIKWLCQVPLTSNCIIFHACLLSDINLDKHMNPHIFLSCMIYDGEKNYYNILAESHQHLVFILNMF